MKKWSVTRGQADDLSKDAMVEGWIKQFEQFADSQGMEEHKTSLNKVEYERYSHQYKLIKDLNEVYEKEPNNFTKIVALMQKMQKCGQPPSDIVSELAPNIDLTNLGQISPEMLQSQTNCCIM